MPKRGDELLIDGRDFYRSAGFRSICRIPIDRVTPQVPGYGSLPCHLGYFHGIKLGILPPIKYCPGGCLSVGNIFVPPIISLPTGFLGAPSHQLFLIGCPTMGNALPGYFPFRVPILTMCDPYLIYPLLYVPINSQYI